MVDLEVIGHLCVLEGPGINPENLLQRTIIKNYSGLFTGLSSRDYGFSVILKGTGKGIDSFSG